MKKLIITIIVLVFTSAGCDRALIELNKNLRAELDSAKKRLVEMEKYVAELKEGTRDVEKLKDVEVRRMQDTYNELTKILMKEIEEGKVEIEKIKDRLTVNVAETVLFDSGSAEIKKDAEPVLLKISEILKKFPEKHIRIEGHTDNLAIGESLKEKYPTNWELAAIRAVNVTRFLQDSGNIEPSRLSASSYSQYRPIASNKTPKGRKKNRRIEILLIDQKLSDIIKKEKI